MAELCTVVAKFRVDQWRLNMLYFQTRQYSRTLQASLNLVIDEVTIGHHHTYEAIDRTLHDIWENDCKFGRLTAVFAGDWRQILLVVHRGARADIVDACLTKSCIWQYVRPLEMTTNIRAEKAGASTQAFAQFLLSIVNGKHMAIIMWDLWKLPCSTWKSFCSVYTLNVDITIHH